jgi:nitrogen fixation NifU-like protein
MSPALPRAVISSEDARFCEHNGVDWIEFQGVIEDAKFKTYGCGSAIASSSLVTEWVRGRTLDEALAIKNADISEELALPPVKIHCSILAEDAIKAAVADFRSRHPAGAATLVSEQIACASSTG